MSKFTIDRRGLLKSSAVIGVGLATPTIFTGRAWGYTNEPKGGTVTLGVRSRDEMVRVKSESFRF